jgi:hypothetical protein
LLPKAVRYKITASCKKVKSKHRGTRNSKAGHGLLKKFDTHRTFFIRLRSTKNARYLPCVFSLFQKSMLPVAAVRAALMLLQILHCTSVFENPVPVLYQTTSFACLLLKNESTQDIGRWHGHQ